jgi:hypothetical protein
MGGQVERQADDFCFVAPLGPGKLAAQLIVAVERALKQDGKIWGFVRPLPFFQTQRGKEVQGEFVVGGQMFQVQLVNSQDSLMIDVAGGNFHQRIARSQQLLGITAQGIDGSDGIDLETAVVLSSAWSHTFPLPHLGNSQNKVGHIAKAFTEHRQAKGKESPGWIFH